LFYQSFTSFYNCFQSPQGIPPTLWSSINRHAIINHSTSVFSHLHQYGNTPSGRAHQQNEGQLYLATDYQGVYVLNRGSNRWEARNGGLPKKLDINSLAVRGDFLAIGTYHGKVFTSKDGGRHWKDPIFNFLGGSVRALHFHEGWLIAGTDNGIYRSADDGMTWQQAGDLIQVNDLAFFEGKLYAARRDGIVVSQDDGKTWSIAYNEYAVSRLLLTENRLYGQVIGTLDGRDFIRSKDGSFWEKMIMVIPGRQHENLPAALWGGFKPQVPEVDMPVRSVTETSFGWFLGVAAGC